MKTKPITVEEFWELEEELDIQYYYTPEPECNCNFAWTIENGELCCDTVCNGTCN